MQSLIPSPISLSIYACRIYYSCKDVRCEHRVVDNLSFFHGYLVWLYAHPLGIDRDGLACFDGVDVTEFHAKVCECIKHRRGDGLSR